MLYNVFCLMGSSQLKFHPLPACYSKEPCISQMSFPMVSFSYLLFSCLVWVNCIKLITNAKAWMYEYSVTCVCATVPCLL